MSHENQRRVATNGDLLMCFARQSAWLAAVSERHASGLTPIGGRSEPDEIAPLAVYLASDGAATVVGQAINMDGGMLMSG